MVRIIGIAAFALIASSVNAQEPEFYHGPGMPRFGIGLDLLLPTLINATAHRSQGAQLVFSYRSAEKRAWRLGYGYWREEYNGGPYWSFGDSLVTVTQVGHDQSIHQFSMGRQWEQGAGWFRTTVGAELLVAYQDISEQEIATTYTVDTTALPSIHLDPSHTNFEGRYQETLMLGPAFFGGFEARLHKHLSLQFRLGAAYLIKLPPVEPNTVTRTPYRTDRIIFLPMGSGLFVQFLF